MKTIVQPCAAPQPQWPVGGGIRSAAVAEISLDELSEGDMLLIQTANSIYSFILADAGQRCGLLMGGRLGEASATAWLTGAQEHSDDDSAMQESHLADGLHAVFLVASDSESRRLVTSAIKRLTHLKVAAGRPNGLPGDLRQPSVESGELTL
ncbi:MAG: hypothetical protein ACJ74J_15045 [Blastocatellia bacterium]